MAPKPNPDRAKASELLNRALDALRSDLPVADWYLLCAGRQVTTKLPEKSLGVIRTCLADYLMHTYSKKIVANSFGFSLRAIRKVLDLVGMSHYEEYIWTPSHARAAREAQAA